MYTISSCYLEYIAPERPWAKVTPNFGVTLSTEEVKVYIHKVCIKYIKYIKYVYIANKKAKNFLSLVNHHESMVNSYRDIRRRSGCLRLK